MLLDHDVNGPAPDEPGQVNPTLYQRLRIYLPSSMNTTFIADGLAGSTYTIRFYEVGQLDTTDPANLSETELAARLADTSNTTLHHQVTITVATTQTTGPRAATSSPTYTYDDATGQATEDLVFRFDNLGSLHDAADPFAVADYAVLVTVTHADGTVTTYAEPVTLVPGTESDVQYVIPRADVEDDATYTVELHHAPAPGWETTSEADQVSQVEAAGPVTDDGGAPLASTIADATITEQVTPDPSDEPTPDPSDEPTPDPSGEPAPPATDEPAPPATDEPTPPATPTDPPASVDPEVYEGGVDDVTFTFDDLNAFHLKNDFDGGDADVFFTFGRYTDRALAGDVTGGGTDTIGVFRR